MPRWIDPPEVNIPASFAALNLPPLIARTLARRGLTDLEAARAFLDPVTYVPASPFELPGMDDALDRLAVATRKHETVCVWGDFDVDGQTATALLVETLRALGLDVLHYIPIRGKESHGVHIETLSPLLDSGVTLFITCDTGITAHDAIDHARTHGADFIVTDHHDPKESLPGALAIVNPKLLPEEHALATISGSAVAFKLAEAMLSQRSLTENHAESSVVDLPDRLLDLVALGLIADLAILKRDARYLTQRGLDVLRNTERAGLQALFEFANVQPAALTETSVSFALGPRLNALGRLGDANPAVELLTTHDPIRARVLAAQIEGLNAQRRLLTDQVTQAAEAELRADPSLLAQPAIVLGHSAWPGGVVGIVANRLVDRYQKPVVLFNIGEDGVARGSARSIDGLHITRSIAAQEHLLRGYGGHPMAAGLALASDKLTAFRTSFGRTVEQMLAEANVEEATLDIDAWLTLDQLDLDLAASIERLAPFGPGNPPLTLATRNLHVIRASEIGRTKEHIKFTVEDSAGRQQDVVWWKSAGEELPDGTFDLAYTVRAGSYRGARQLNVEYLALRVTQEEAVKVRRRGPEVIDLRAEATSAQIPREAAIWAEGADREMGLDRFHLERSLQLAILTPPSSPTELRGVLERVQPEQVFVRSVAPPPEKADEFLKKLAGLTKYAINKRAGRVSLQELAAVTAQREATVQLGLEWLRAGGHISFEGEDSLEMRAGSREPNPYAQQELYVAVKGALEETAAYRKYFSTVKDIAGLFEFPR